jgi:hypothetical protein
MGWRDYQLPAYQNNTFLQTTLTEIKGPLLIESRILKDRFYLVANETQAREIEQKGHVCYLPQEIKTLLVNSAGMSEGDLKEYLGKVHAVKKTFEGTRIYGKAVDPFPVS